jgi:hypothetical protein
LKATAHDVPGTERTSREPDVSFAFGSKADINRMPRSVIGHERSLLKVRLKQPLRTYEEGRTVVTMPARVTFGRNFCAEYEDARLSVFWQRSVNALQQYIALVLFTGFQKTIKL